MLNVETIEINQLTAISTVRGIDIYSTTCDEFMALGGAGATRVTGSDDPAIYAIAHVLSDPEDYEDVVCIHESLLSALGADTVDFIIQHEIAHIELGHMERFFDIAIEDRLNVALADHSLNEITADALAFTRCSRKASEGAIVLLQMSLSIANPYNPWLVKDRIEQLTRLLAE